MYLQAEMQKYVGRYFFIFFCLVFITCSVYYIIVVT